MSESNIELFSPSSSVFLMPTGSAPDIQAKEEEQSDKKVNSCNDFNSQAKLMSDDVVKAIGGEFIKTSMLPEEDTVILPNYVLDLTNIKEVRPIQQKALQSFLRDDGDTALYLYFGDTLCRAGMIDGYLANRVLASSMDSVFMEEAKVYRDYVPGKPTKVVKRRDISQLRLSI